MLKAREGRYGLQPVHESGRITRPLGPEVCSSHFLLRKTVPQGLKATKTATFMPGINPRPTLKTSFSAACKARTYLPLPSTSSFAQPVAAAGILPLPWPIQQKIFPSRASGNALNPHLCPVHGLSQHRSRRPSPRFPRGWESPRPPHSWHAGT